MAKSTSTSKTKTRSKAGTKRAAPKTSGRKRARPRPEPADEAGAGTEPHERFFGRLQEDFGQLRDTIAGEVRRAVDKAGERGIVDPEKLKRVEAEVRSRMTALSEQAAEAGRELARQTRRLADDERVRSAADTGITALHGLAASLRGMAERMEEALAERRTFHAGESQPAGSYACHGCGETTVLGRTASLKPCGRCGGSTFKRVE